MAKKGNAKMYDIVTFGEAMMRLSPPNFRRFEQATQFDMCVGGGELNVAVVGARIGLTTAWVSRLPENPLGRLVRNRAREMGVDTGHIVWSKNGRVGIYFCEFGAKPRASSVVYDRAGSAISLMRLGGGSHDGSSQGGEAQGREGQLRPQLPR